jgi:LysM repeat protein
MKEKILCLLVCSFIVAGCTPAPPSELPLPAQTLRAYLSPTPAPRESATQAVPSPPPLPAVTPTPWMHVVQPDDTLLGIAARYGVELADLLAANPEIDPRFLSLDMEIRIPVDGTSLNEALSAAATPFPLPVGDVVCYQTFGNELWCITEVNNDSDQNMESIAAEMYLYSVSGELVISQPVYAPLNILPPGASMPLAAGFQFDSAADFSFTAIELVSAFPANQIEERYLLIEAVEEELLFSDQKKRVEWKGELQLQEGADGSSIRASLLLIAYGENGRPVGFRKVEFDNLEPNSTVAVQVAVYSLGPEIDRTGLLVEAQYEQE